MKKILITGANSYIGTSFEKYMEQFGDEYVIDTVDMISDSWKSKDFSGYDCVFHVAGIAHQKETLKNAHLYYEVNRNLAIATAKKAKRDGVKQFILLSSMSVYGMETGVITKNTVPHPKSHYGKSKLQADEKIVKLNCDKFKVAILRPPMVYGRGCKGNYQKLRKFALTFPIFPDYPNQRSMVYIDNLCEFVKNTIDENRQGLFLPQNAEYVNTSKMVKEIATSNGKYVRLTTIFNPFIRIAPMGIIKKVFGSLIYDDNDIVNHISTPKSVFLLESNTIEPVKSGKFKKALIIGSMASMLDNFNRNNISILDSLGYEITLAANFKDEDSNSLKKNQLFRKEMELKGYKVVHIDFSRSISNLPKQIKSVKQVRSLLKNKYDLVHCNSPICSVITRLAYEKYRRRVDGKILYTAHGFHFYDGAPKKNWCIYYPVEKLCSWFTDVLITINKEDYNRAKKYFHAKKTVYVPGIGIDVKKFADVCIDRSAKRSELGIKDNDIMLLSVGELNENKNHSAVIKALGQIQDRRIHYFIAGKGDLDNYLKNLASTHNVNLHLLGFRTDVAELYKCADIYVLPSKREGLNVSLMEAMASGLPCIASRIRGNTDLLSFSLFSPTDKIEIKNALIESISKIEKLAKNNPNRIKQFSTEIVNERMNWIYRICDSEV